MTESLFLLSAIASAVCTILIACFTKINLELSKKSIALSKATLELNENIQKSSQQFQEDMKKFHIDLVAASLLAATNPPGKPLKTAQLNEYRTLIGRSWEV